MEESTARPVGSGAADLSSRRASGSLAVVPPLALLQSARTAGGDLRLVLRNTANGAVLVVVFRKGETTMVFSPGDGRSVGELLLAAGLLDRKTVDRLVEQRPEAGASLQQFLLQRTSLSYVDVQRFLDFQARQRLLDALVWDEGFFRLEEYDGGEETGFNLGLPSFESMSVRARARRDALRDLVGKLPAPPARMLVRRRRGATKPLDSWEREVFGAIDRPMLVPQVIARMLADDDLVLGAVLRMAERRQVVLEPRAAIARPSESPYGHEARSLIRDVAEMLHGSSAPAVPDIWVLVLSAGAGTATRLVGAFGGEQTVTTMGDETGAPSGVSSTMVSVGSAGRLCLMAARPDALSRGALEGILGRCDAITLVREGASPGESDRLAALRDRVLSGVGTWRPLVVGVELGASLRPWDQYPDAVIGLPEPEGSSPARLVEHLLSGLLAASKCRSQAGS